MRCKKDDSLLCKNRIIVDQPNPEKLTLGGMEC